MNPFCIPASTIDWIDDFDPVFEEMESHKC